MPLVALAKSWLEVSDGIKAVKVELHEDRGFWYRDAAIASPVEL